MNIRRVLASIVAAVVVLLVVGCDQAGIGNKMQTINVNQQQVILKAGTNEAVLVLNQDEDGYVPVEMASANLLSARQVVFTDGKYVYIGQEASS